MHFQSWCFTFSLFISFLLIHIVLIPIRHDASNNKNTRTQTTSTIRTHSKRSQKVTKLNKYASEMMRSTFLATFAQNSICFLFGFVFLKTGCAYLYVCVICSSQNESKFFVKCTDITYLHIQNNDCEPIKIGIWFLVCQTNSTKKKPQRRQLCWQ